MKKRIRKQQRSNKRNTQLRPIADRLAAGKTLRAKVPRGDHAKWSPPRRRRDPIEILIESSEGRVAELVPIRYGRMMQSPFAFYRGAAAIMAADLAHTQVTRLLVQASGVCHLLNFGAFATPERRIIFDLNDFDETLPGPWEWDVKRLVASFVIASRNNKLKRAEGQAAARSCARSYRKWMRRYAEMHPLELWYCRIDAETAVASLTDKASISRLKSRIEAAEKQNVPEHDFPKLVSVNGGAPRISDNPPLIFHPRDAESEAFRKDAHHTFAKYRETLPDERRLLLDRFTIVDVAQKVVGVGSVGTWCGILLMMTGDEVPLFLQVKEARRSVLEPYAGPSVYAHRGQRVVVGQRLMQSASDMFLGWTEGPAGRHFYLRQLRDMKITPLVEVFSGAVMAEYASLCGWALARAHARSGDAATIAGYLGSSGAFDDAIAAFGDRYADQNERDFEALKAAVESGRVEAFVE